MDTLSNGRSGQWMLWAMDALLNPEIHFRRVRKIAETDCEFRHVCPSICLSTWNNSAPTERIS
jgi:hypothetical protein